MSMYLFAAAVDTVWLWSRRQVNGCIHGALSLTAAVEWELVSVCVYVCEKGREGEKVWEGRKETEKEGERTEGRGGGAHI